MRGLLGKEVGLTGKPSPAVEERARSSAKGLDGEVTGQAVCAEVEDGS